MSKKADKESVFLTTKVRTKLKGDGSWLQRRSEAQDETNKEKPWLAEVRAGRLNGEPLETSPPSSPTTSTPPALNSDAQRTPSSGYPVSVSTKLECPTPSPTSNGASQTATQFPKKPSGSYKKIAPYAVRPTAEIQEAQLSSEEQEKRTEAASSVLMKSAGRQRSYVLSAAKKYESQDKPPETSLANDSPAFVAKRVEIVDDDKSAATPAPASNPPTSPAAPATSVASAPEPKPASVADAEPVALKVGEVAPAPVKEDPPPGSAAVEDPFEDKQPGSTKVAAPLPVVIPECFQAVPAQPEPKASAIRVNTPLVDLAPAAPSPTSPTAAARGPSTPVPLTPTPVSTVTTQAKPELVEKPASKPSSSVDTLTDLSNTLITFNSSSTSVVEAAPALAEEEAGSANSHTTQIGDEEEPAPELSSRKPLTDDLLAFTDGPVESGAEPVPPSAGRWSQDLLSGLNSLSTRPEEKQTDETARETQRPTETVTITTKTVIITDKSREDDADPWSSQRQSTVTESSSADPFDPYPIGTTSSNSSSDLLQPDSDISSSSARTQRSWASTWETSPPPQADTEESREASPADQMVDQETLVRFERKSSENDSPWDKWTSPTLYTLPGAEEEEEEEEEESTAYTQTETVTTTITTIREGSDERHVTDRYQTYSRSTTEEDQRVVTPEPEAKRGFVYLKEYVNATEVSLHNARDTPDGGSDYVTSSSTSHSYSSPSTYSSGLPSSDCNFCGEPVGNDAKITIEHLNINCHPRCFKCGVCKKPMGDLLDSMFLHGGKVHCEICYNEA